jgi:ectoine hydroxylase-related dioxygenase (phytanoyl-CoA dioxygenase family)
MLLTEAQVARYRRDGCLFPIPILTEEEARAACERLETIEAAEEARRGGPWCDREYLPWEHADSPLLPFVKSLVTHPALVGTVSSLLGPDILLRNAGFFAKPPAGPADRFTPTVSWHFDQLCSIEEARYMVSAWLALTPATPQNGCMYYKLGSHELDLPEGPKDKFSLDFNQATIARIDRLPTVAVELEAGALALHQARCSHRSGPNQTRHRRIGLSMTFFSPRMSPTASDCGQAYVIAGTDTGPYGRMEKFPISWWAPRPRAAAGA